MKPSRAMIPGEILCALFGFVLAIHGGLIDGPLHTLLKIRGDVAAWLIILGIPSLLTLHFSTKEWFLNGQWNLKQRDKSCERREKLMLLQGFCWFYAVYIGANDGAGIVGWLGMVGAAYCAWSVWENRRTRREIRYATLVKA